MYKKKDETKKMMQDSISNEQIRMIRANLESTSESKSAIFIVTSPVMMVKNQSFHLN